MSSIKDQIRGISTELRHASSEVILKVVKVFVLPARDHWATEAVKHQEVASRYPEGSSLRRSAEIEYTKAFQEWHRLSYFLKGLDDALNFRPLGKVPASSMQKAA